LCAVMCPDAVLSVYRLPAKASQRPLGMPAAIAA
jgi:hypothetical protein